MGEPKHTPGPWEIRDPYGRPSSVGLIGPADQSPVCCITGYHGIETSEANARLIVTAPDMLEALKAMTDFAKSYIGRMDSGEVEQFELARSVIAEAEGPTS